jgi:hypothetical protein
MTEITAKDKADLVLEREFSPDMKATVANIERRVKQYVMVRDQIKVIEERHAKELENIKAIKDELTGIIQSCLEAVGAESIKTAEGTAYTTTRYTASLADPKAFMDYVIEYKKFDLMDRKANAPAVRDYVAETGSLPPGVTLSSIATIGVRRAPGK